MKGFIYIVLMLSMVFAPGCKFEDNSRDQYPPVKASRLLCVYLAMDNDLSGAGEQNMRDIIEGATAENLNGGQILIYLNSKDQLPVIRRIYADNNGVVRNVVARTYPAHNSADYRVMQDVIEYMSTIVVADSRALIIGSHSQGWIPGSFVEKYARAPQPGAGGYVELPTRSLIYDDDGVGGFESMELADFAGAIPSKSDTRYGFGFIILDMCYSGSAEVAYELRDKADYIIVSPSEVMVAGMPYKEIIGDIFADEPRLGEGGVCEKYYEHYKTGDTPHGAISLIDCSKLETLAKLLKDNISAKYEEIQAIEDLSDIQRYDRYTLHTMFDMKEFLYFLLPPENDIRTQVDAALQEAVIYKKTTGAFGELLIPGEKFSGLSMYIPVSAYSDLNKEYNKGQWSKMVFNRPVTE